MPFTFRRHASLPDVVVVEPRVFPDDRGWFQETYKRTDYERFGIPGDFRQDNHSRSTTRGVIRGLHYQINPRAQGKLVRCVVGAIFDVAVDIRRGSPTYGKWIAGELSAANHRQLWIPEGFAHAICTVSEIAEVLYKTTAEYSQEHERSIRWDDPRLAIRWPVEKPELSPRDAQAPLLAAAENNFVWRAPA